MMDLATLKKAGSDRQYRAWIQQQPSCISGAFSEYVHGDGRSIAAHVRRAGQSGTGYKAEYSCVPLTDREHRLYEHQKGSSSLGKNKEWFDNKRLEYLERWYKQAMDKKKKRSI